MTGPKPTADEITEAQRVVEELAEHGKQFTDRAAYETSVARNLATERLARDEADSQAALIAECGRCDHLGYFYEDTAYAVTVTAYRCRHA